MANVEMPAANTVRPRISKDFWLYEFDCKDGTPVNQVVELSEFVIKNLQPLRTFLGLPIFISSAYRTPEYNKAIGGVSNSYHLYDKNMQDEDRGAFAVDLRVPGMEPALVKLVIEGLIRLDIMDEGGIGLYKNFVHYDNRGYRARW